jgi:hypothetical protein
MTDFACSATVHPDTEGAKRLGLNVVQNFLWGHSGYSQVLGCKVSINIKETSCQREPFPSSPPATV